MGHRDCGVGTEGQEMKWWENEGVGHEDYAGRE